MLQDYIKMRGIWMIAIIPFVFVRCEVLLGGGALLFQGLFQGECCIPDWQRHHQCVLSDRQGLLIPSLLAQVLLGIVKTLDWLVGWDRVA